MKFKKILSLSLNSIIGVSVPSGLIFGLVSCGNDASSAVETSETVYASVKAILNSKSPTNPNLLLPGFDDRNNKANFFYKLASSISYETIPNSLNTNEVIKKTFKISSENFIESIKAMSKVDASLLTTEQLLSLSDDFNRYWEEFLKFITNVAKDNSFLEITPTATMLMTKDSTTNKVYIEGTVNSTLQGLKTFFESRLKKSTLKSVLDLEIGLYLPYSDLYPNGPEDDLANFASLILINAKVPETYKTLEEMISMSFDFAKPLKKPLPGYEAWLGPKLSVPKNELVVGTFLKVTWTTRFLHDPVYASSSFDENITFERLIKIDP